MTARLDFGTGGATYVAELSGLGRRSLTKVNTTCTTGARPTKNIMFLSVMCRADL